MVDIVIAILLIGGVYVGMAWILRGNEGRPGK